LGPREADQFHHAADDEHQVVVVAVQHHPEAAQAADGHFGRPAEFAATCRGWVGTVEVRVAHGCGPRGWNLAEERWARKDCRPDYKSGRRCGGAVPRVSPRTWRGAGVSGAV